jgi:hypothetical protein
MKTMDSITDTAMRLRAGQSGVRIPPLVKIFRFSRPAVRRSGSRGTFLGKKRPECDADHSPPFSVPRLRMELDLESLYMPSRYGQEKRNFSKATVDLY